MPLYFHKKLANQAELGIWKIDETEVFFQEQLELAPEEAAQLARIKGARRTQWLAARYLVHQMSGRSKRGIFIKDEFGKPHLEHSPYQISISHSGEFAAAIAAPFSIGIDIQRIVERIDRIAHKFMRPIEAASLEQASRIPHLHVYWGAKEALYKAYGRRKLDFCRHLLITPFPFKEAKGQFQGKVAKGDYDVLFDLYYEIIENQVLVYALESGY